MSDRLAEIRERWLNDKRHPMYRHHKAQGDINYLLKENQRLRLALEEEEQSLANPGGLHRYDKGGTHSSTCLACSLLARLRQALNPSTERVKK